MIRVVRPSASAPLLLFCALAAPGPWAEDPIRAGDGPSACLHEGLRPSGTEDLVAEALRVLEQSGHDPTAYRLELRSEDARHPDFPVPGAERATSVLFVPAEAGDLYPLRVHPMSPCVAAWVWQPERLTDWQRRVVAVAEERLAALPAARSLSGRRYVRVLESETLLRIEVGDQEWDGETGSGRALSVTLRKEDLGVVDVTR
jgi:hypothetical protein